MAGGGDAPAPAALPRKSWAAPTQAQLRAPVRERRLPSRQGRHRCAHQHRPLLLPWPLSPHSRPPGLNAGRVAYRANSPDRAPHNICDHQHAQQLPYPPGPCIPPRACLGRRVASLRSPAGNGTVLVPACAHRRCSEPVAIVPSRAAESSVHYSPADPRVMRAPTRTILALCRRSSA